MGLSQTLSAVASTSSNVMGGAWVFVWLVLIVLTIAAYWMMFEKAGEAGWKSIIPLYNTYTLFRIAGRNGWGMLLMLIPIVNVIVFLMVAMDLAKHFGKSTTFGVVALWLFSVIGFLILGFGDAKYVGTKHA